MRTDEARMLHLEAHLDHLDGEGPLPPPVQGGKKRGSFNHEFLLRVGMYADDSPLDFLREWLEVQKKEGHCSRLNAIETFSASHGQLNEAAAAVGLLFAVRRSHNGLIEALRDWWWSEMTLCNEMAIPGRETQPFDNTNAEKGVREPDVFGPGWRAMQQGKLVGSNPCRDLCWRVVMGHPIPKAGHRLWKSRYYLATRALRMLPEYELKALRPAPGFKPPLPYSLVIHRGEDRFFAQWEAPANGDVALAAVWSPLAPPSLHTTPFPEAIYPEGFHRHPGLRGIAGENVPA